LAALQPPAATLGDSGLPAAPSVAPSDPVEPAGTMTIVIGIVIGLAVLGTLAGVLAST
jgi:hypothetical protein